MSDVVGRGSKGNPADLTSGSKSEPQYSLYLKVKKFSIPNKSPNKSVDGLIGDKDTDSVATISKDVAELAKKLDKKKLELFYTNTYDIVHRKIPPRRQLDEIAALFAETFSELLGATAEFAILPEQALTLDMLEAMTLKERWAALDRHYSTRTSWEKVRTNDPTAEEMLSWIEANFPDREELMLVYGDLKRLDKSAYDKIDNWINIEKKQDKLSESNRLRKSVKVPEDRFGFPTKRSRNDRLIADGVIPTASEVYERLKEGDPRFRGMLRRYSMAQKRGRPLD